ncbi:hypothetical protein E2C01_011372 [Portunus trituberculatus]|uniref:Secreted protein n=1 Tax=Portunus trituberculatus TaxID=210409 RepID=A0A5B7DBI8_PORTR|nr:hypothetical protein [Portunus trituberculatus]
MRAFRWGGVALWAAVRGHMTSWTSWLTVVTSAVDQHRHLTDQRLWSGVNPSLVWGPALENHREEWMDYCASNPLLHRYFHRDFDCRPKQSEGADELRPMENKGP